MIDFTGTRMIQRGGSWLRFTLRNKLILRATYRIGSKHSNIGLRIVKRKETKNEISQIDKKGRG